MDTGERIQMNDDLNGKPGSNVGLTNDSRSRSRLPRIWNAAILFLLTGALAFLVYSSQVFVAADRGQTYSGAILLCVGLLVFFTRLWFRPA